MVGGSVIVTAGEVFNVLDDRGKLDANVQIGVSLEPASTDCLANEAILEFLEGAQTRRDVGERHRGVGHDGTNAGFVNGQLVIKRQLTTRIEQGKEAS